MITIAPLPPKIPEGGDPDAAFLPIVPPKFDPSPDQYKALEAALAWCDKVIDRLHAKEKPPEGEDDPFGYFVRPPAPKPFYALRASHTDPVWRLGGLAGTGKSTLTGVLARLLSHLGVTVLFATYTGKAAGVLSRSLARAGSMHTASTIHQLIYTPIVDVESGRVTDWARRAQIAATLIVVDEASMVPPKVLDDLLAYGIPILSVGDHGQLPPIFSKEEATGLREAISRKIAEEGSLMAKPDFALEEIHRQAKGNPIIELASYVRNSWSHPRGSIVNWVKERQAARPSDGAKPDDRVTLDHDADGITRAFKAAGVYPGSKASYLVLCSTNRTRCGLNSLARRATADGTPTTEAPPKYPQRGEPLVCLKNLYLDDENSKLDPSACLSPGRVPSMIPNGSRCVVLRCEEHDRNRLSCDLRFGADLDGDETNDAVAGVLGSFDLRNILISKHQLGLDKTFKGYGDVPYLVPENERPRRHHSWDTVGALFDFGYVMTAHKAQGSQARHVVVCLEGWLGKTLDEQKKWVYTALTRASERLTIVLE